MKQKKLPVVMGIAAILSMTAAASVCAEGNRYDFERYYTAEISPAQAYMKMVAGDAILIDVRRDREYAAGHPADDADSPTVQAFHIPYPHAVFNNDRSPQELYDDVWDLTGGDTSVPIMLLCRTGARSVRAGNILTNPAAYGVTGDAYDEVYNIWEGFVGQYKEAYVADPGYDSVKDVAKSERGSSGKNGVPHILLDHESLHHRYLDLNNDDELNEDEPDVYEETADMNPDKDGWRNYQGLPWTTELNGSYTYQDTGNYGPYTPVAP